MKTSSRNRNNSTSMRLRTSSWSRKNSMELVLGAIGETP